MPKHLKKHKEFLIYQTILEFYHLHHTAHEELEKLKDSTKKKLIQVLFRILSEAEITSEVNIILPSILTKRVARALVPDKSGKSELYILLPVSNTDFKEWVK